MPTRRQLDDRQRAIALRRSLAIDLRRLREDAGITRVALAREAGVHPSMITRIEQGTVNATLETYGRLAAALGADLAARVYPNTGPRLRDRHQVRMAELLLASLHRRWRATPEVAVHRPARGWIDVVLSDAAAGSLVASELESGLYRIEQLLRWSRAKAESLESAAGWSAWSGSEAVSRLLVIRWTRSNREAASAARRTLHEAYPADPRDAFEALTGTAPWPGPAMLWARLDGPEPGIVPAAT